MTSGGGSSGQWSGNYSSQGNVGFPANSQQQPGFQGGGMNRFAGPNPSSRVGPAGSQPVTSAALPTASAAGGKQALQNMLRARHPGPNQFAMQQQHQQQQPQQQQQQQQPGGAQQFMPRQGYPGVRPNVRMQQGQGGQAGAGLGPGPGGHMFSGGGNQQQQQQQPGGGGGQFNSGPQWSGAAGPSGGNQGQFMRGFQGQVNRPQMMGK